MEKIEYNEKLGIVITTIHNECTGVISQAIGIMPTRRTFLQKLGDFFSDIWYWITDNIIIIIDLLCLLTQIVCIVYLIVYLMIH